MVHLRVVVLNNFANGLKRPSIQIGLVRVNVVQRVLLRGIAIRRSKVDRDAAV